MLVGLGLVLLWSTQAVQCHHQLRFMSKLQQFDIQVTLAWEPGSGYCLAGFRAKRLSDLAEISFTVD